MTYFTSITECNWKSGFILISSITKLIWEFECYIYHLSYTCIFLSKCNFSYLKTFQYCSSSITEIAHFEISKLVLLEPNWKNGKTKSFCFDVSNLRLKYMYKSPCIDKFNHKVVLICPTSPYLWNVTFCVVGITTHL